MGGPGHNLAEGREDVKKDLRRHSAVGVCFERIKGRGKEER